MRWTAPWIVLGGWLIAGALPARAVTFDALGDFSLTGNPNGSWSYRSGSDGAATPFELLTVPSTPCIVAGLECWHNALGFPNAVLVARNTTGSDLRYSNTIVQPADLLEICGQTRGVSVRWTAPNAGTWVMNGRFQVIDLSPAIHNVGVVKNALGAGQATVLGPVAMSAFGQVVSIDLMLDLAAGDTIDFVNFGTPNGSFLSVGLTVSISDEGPPTTTTSSTVTTTSSTESSTSTTAISTTTTSPTSTTTTTLSITIDRAVAARVLIVIDRLVAKGRAQVFFEARDAAISKGAGNDPRQIAAALAIAYDEASGEFAMPGGDAWSVKEGRAARYRNPEAPTGGSVRAGTVRKGAIEVLAKSLGEAALDVSVVPTSPVSVVLAVTNGSERLRFCTRFTGCTHKAISRGTGRKLVCKSGVPDTSCGD